MPMIDPTPPITSLGQGSGPNAAATAAATDFDTFLQLLTAQMRHQDPLAPADPTQFVSQLATFSQVEQSLQTNQKLADVVKSLRAGEATAALSYMGKTVEAPMDHIRLADGDAGFAYAVGSAAAEVSVVIKDSNGDVVRTIVGETGAGRHEAVWDGLLDDGTAAEKGNYRIEIAAKDKDGKAVDASLATSDLVERVVFDQGIAVLVLRNGAEIYPQDVLSASS